MKIQQSNVALSSSYRYEKNTKQTESLKVWFGPRPNEENRVADLGRSGMRAALLTPSMPSRTYAPPNNHTTQSECSDGVTDAEEDVVDTDPYVLILRSVLERMFGEKWEPMRALRIDECNAAAIARECSPSPLPSTPGEKGPQREGWGIEYDLQETQQETEQLAFSAGGIIKTADGQEIKFDLKLNLQREYAESRTVQIRAGDATIPVDPLVINFMGQAAELTERTFQFDLNADGNNETIASVKAGSAFLALDKNSDGKINDGHELFGPQSGNGFAELARYDSDQNGWIDESDPVYKELRLRLPDLMVSH